MDHKSMLRPIIQAEGLLCSAMAVKRADCAAPMKHIHVVSDNWAGYLFRVDAWISIYKLYVRVVMISSSTDERTKITKNHYLNCQQNNLFLLGPSQVKFSSKTIWSSEQIIRLDFLCAIFVWSFCSHSLKANLEWKYSSSKNAVFTSTK